MRNVLSCVAFCLVLSSLSACSTYSTTSNTMPEPKSKPTPVAVPPQNYASRIPGHINTSEKVVVVDPRVHAWGAYGANGDLIRAGLATAGSSWCPDLGRPCRTKVGSFRVNSLGSPNCKSTIFPLPRGGAPMPYCMFFNKNQGLHGSYEVVEGNVSHGCVRMHVSDAEWLRYNFVNIGTKVIVRPY